MKSQEAIAIMRVSTTYAGTVIGAGFASGQEITQFFVSYGQVGLAGIAISSILFAWLGGQLLNLGHHLRATAYHEAIYHLCGYRLGIILDTVTSTFLFATLTIMLAGAATVLRDYFDLPYVVGLIFFGLAVLLTVLHGVNGVAKMNMVVTPLLVVSIIGISTFSLWYHDFTPSMLKIASDELVPPTPHWLLGSLLYVSYNIVISSTIMIPLGSTVPSRQIRIIGGALGGLVLGLLATCLASVMMLHHPEILIHEVPILHIANIQHIWNGSIYAASLLAAMYTTAIAALYGCSAKLAATTKLLPLPSALIVTTAALFCGQAGFATLIGLLFPLFGYATLYFTARLAWLSLRGN